MMALVHAWWLLLFGPEVRADVTVCARTVGLARQEAQYVCGQHLDAQCFDRGLDRALAPNVGWPQCDEDDAGWATCTTACSGTCSERED